MRISRQRSPNTNKEIVNCSNKILEHLIIWKIAQCNKILEYLICYKIDTLYRNWYIKKVSEDYLTTLFEAQRTPLGTTKQEKSRYSTLPEQPGAFVQWRIFRFIFTLNTRHYKVNKSKPAFSLQRRCSNVNWYSLSFREISALGQKQERWRSKCFSKTKKNI